ncbi:MAG: ABC transporter substrate-binding protein [Marinifilaceae bacterium]
MKRILSVFCVAILLFSVWGCKNKVKKDEKEVIKIGAILPLTGKYSDVGNWMKVGVYHALQKLQDTLSNKTIKVYYEDAQSTAIGAVNAYNKLKNINEIDVLITGTSALSLALKPLAVKDDILLFSVASHPKITSVDDDNVFRFCNTSKEESNTIIDYAIENSGDRKDKISIVYHNSEFGLSFKNDLENGLKKKVVSEYSYDDKSEDVENLVINVLKEKPSEILLIGFTPTMGRVLKKLFENNFNGEIICNIGFNSPNVTKIAGKAADHVKFVDYCFPTNDSYYKELDKLSKKDFKISFTSMSFLAYSSILFIDKNVKWYDGKYKIAKNIEILKEWNIGGVNYTLNEKGDMLPKLFINEFNR